jgi:cytochrome c1
MSKPNKKLVKPVKFMQQHVESGIALTVQAVEEYLKAYNAAKKARRNGMKTLIVIVLSNLGTLIASALGMG